MTSTLAPAEPRRRVDGRLVVLLVVIALGTRGLLRGSLDPVALRTWTTVFVAIVVQALPFLALGVLVSGAITALVSPVVGVIALAVLAALLHSVRSRRAEVSTAVQSQITRASSLNATVSRRIIGSSTASS